MCESTALAQLLLRSTSVNRSRSAAAGHPALLPCLRITCLLRSVARRAVAVVQQLLLQIGSSSPLPAASTSLAAAAAASNNCLPEDSLPLHCQRSGAGVGGGWSSELVFTSFSLQFQSAGDVLAMAWPEVRGGGRPPRDCRSRRVSGGRGGSNRPPVTAPHLNDRFHSTAPSWWWCLWCLW